MNLRVRMNSPTPLTTSELLNEALKTPMKNINL